MLKSKIIEAKSILTEGTLKANLVYSTDFIIHVVLSGRDYYCVRRNAIEMEQILRELNAQHDNLDANQMIDFVKSRKNMLITIEPNNIKKYFV